MQGYCVKCKAKRDMKDEKEVTTANKRQMMKGLCTVCNTKMNVILGKK